MSDSIFEKSTKWWLSVLSSCNKTWLIGIIPDLIGMKANIIGVLHSLISIKVTLIGMIAHLIGFANNPQNKDRANALSFTF